MRPGRGRWPLRAAEESRLFLVSSCLWFLKSLKTCSLRMAVWPVSGIRGDELIQGLLKSSRLSHEEVGILGQEAKGAPPLLFSNNSHSAQLASTTSAVPGWEVSSQQVCMAAW